MRFVYLDALSVSQTSNTAIIVVRSPGNDDIDVTATPAVDGFLA
jgi:hypothetical protein